MRSHLLVRGLLTAALAFAVSSCSRSASRAPAPDSSGSGAAAIASPAPGQGSAVGRLLGIDRLRRDREVTVPAGTPVSVRLNATVSSASAASGEVVEGQLASPLELGRETVAGIGSGVEVRVESAVPSGRLGRSARLVTTLVAVDVNGRRFPVVSSEIARGDPAHAKRNARLIGGGAAIGALVGQILGGNSRSTLRGAAVGAAAGTGAAAATGKLDVTIGAGEVLTFTFAEPLSVRESETAHG